MPVIHVAVGVLSDAHGWVLITRRPPGTHQGGLWEFPGGKLEPGEDLPTALARELQEELGVQVRRSEPLIKVAHEYGDRRVLLDVHRVIRWEGEPQGREGQPLRWLAPERLQESAFPAADRPIIAALRLPDRYLITGQDPRDPKAFLRRLSLALESGARLIQLRAKALSEEPYLALARQAAALCREHGAVLLLNAPSEWVSRVECGGVHLSSARLRSLRRRPLPRTKLVGASCHNPEELLQAQRLGADLAVLSPLRPTPSHPGIPGIGWDAFRSLVEGVALPVYALGGLAPADIPQARRCGAQGIAAIRGLWPDL